jgi:hypothetical protein
MVASPRTKNQEPRTKNQEGYTTGNAGVLDRDVADALAGKTP